MWPSNERTSMNELMNEKVAKDLAEMLIISHKRRDYEAEPSKDELFFEIPAYIREQVQDTVDFEMYVRSQHDETAFSLEGGVI